MQDLPFDGRRPAARQHPLEQLHTAPMWSGSLDFATRGTIPPLVVEHPWPKVPYVWLH